MKKIILLSLITINILSMENDSEDAGYGGYSGSLPIYYYPKEKNSPQVHLYISIPKKFKCINDSDFFKEYLFYEKPNQAIWSECINTHYALNSNAQNQLLALRILISKNSTHIKVIYCSTEDMITHTIATAIISYIRNNRHEIMFARYISGLNCCSGFRYTINATNKDHRQVIKKLKEFAEINTQIKDWGKSSPEEE